MDEILELMKTENIYVDRNMCFESFLGIYGGEISMAAQFLINRLVTRIDEEKESGNLSQLCAAVFPKIEEYEKIKKDPSEVAWTYYNKAMW